MRRGMIPVLLILMLMSSAAAQPKAKGDWDAIRKVSRGTAMSIKAWRDVTCEFKDATEDQLFCDPITLLGDESEIVFNRKDIRQVRLELTPETNATVNGFIGAVVGVGLGAVANARHPHSGDDARFWLGIGGAVIGGVGGRDIHLVHGRVIYRR